MTFWKPQHILPPEAKPPQSWLYTANQSFNLISTTETNQSRTHEEPKTIRALTKTSLCTPFAQSPLFFKTPQSHLYTANQASMYLTQPKLEINLPRTHEEYKNPPEHEEEILPHSRVEVVGSSEWFEWFEWVPVVRDGAWLGFLVGVWGGVDGEVCLGVLERGISEKNGMLTVGIERMLRY